MKTFNTIDLTYENQAVKDGFMSDFSVLYDTNMLQGDKELEELRAKLKPLMGVSHVALTGSGTMALELAARALGLGPGDEVVVPANTFFASATGLAKTGCSIVMADVDPETFNATPEAVERVLTEKTRAICLVHLYGGLMDFEPFRKFGLPLIEDASHAFGGELCGRKVGSMGDVSAFSAGPIKSFGSIGHSGILGHNTEAWEPYLDAFINNGQTRRHYAEHFGHNYRMDTAAALFLSHKVDRWADFAARRKANARAYDEVFSQAGVAFQKPLPGADPVLWVYVLRLDPSLRDKVLGDLREQGVNGLVQYTYTINQLPVFQEIGAGTPEVPVAEQLCHEILSIPVHPGLEPADATRIAEMVVASINKHRG